MRSVFNRCTVMKYGIDSCLIFLCVWHFVLRRLKWIYFLESKGVFSSFMFLFYCEKNPMKKIVCVAKALYILFLCRWAALLHWLTCSFLTINMGTLVQLELISHTLFWLCKYLLAHQNSLQQMHKSLLFVFRKCTQLLIYRTWPVCICSLFWLTLSPNQIYSLTNCK